MGRRHRHVNGTVARARALRPTRAAGVAATAVALAVLAGCADDVPGTDPDGTITDGPVTDGPGGLDAGPVDATRSALRRLGDRETFLAELRGALIGQREADGHARPATDDAFVDGIDADFAGGTADAGAGTPQASSADGAAVTDAAAAGGRTFTGTNVQEAGVDERDRVKTDGEYLFVLESSYGDVDPPPGPIPVAGPGAPAIGSADLDPAGTSAPAPDARATVLRILGLEPDAPDAVPVANLGLDLGGRDASGLYLYGEGDARAAIVTASGGGYYASWGESVAFRGLDTLVRRVDAGDPASPSVGASLLIEGQAVSSRRIGRHLFLASRFHPDVPGVDPYAVDAPDWAEAVAAAPDEALLPRYATEDGRTAPLIDPADCFVAPRPDTAEWYSPDVVTLSVIDLDTLRPVDSECFLGASETLYASPESVYLATTRWDHASGPVTEDGRVVDPDSAIASGDAFWQDPRVETDVHRFRIGDGALDYAGSGSVRGHLGWNPERMPYRLSERDGHLRVATINDAQGPDASPILLTVLNVPDPLEGPAAGPAPMRRVAELPNEANPGFIGKPGEQLYASRFVGDRAYLVTFRQTDPLYVLDLADPTDPRVAGELEIEGYSDWLLPVGDAHVLGIGKDAVPVQDGFGDGRGALFQGLKLSLFDVADPASPREVRALVVGERGTESVALHDPRAITIMPGDDGRPTRVAFGIDVHGAPEPAGRPSPDATDGRAFDYAPWSYSGLHAFEVRTGADAGIERRGVLVAESSDGVDPYDYPELGSTGGGDRAVIVDDALYYVHGSGVRVAPWGEPGAAVGPR